jgi:hypothetical protein
VTAIALASCGGGGGSTTTAAPPVPPATAAPVAPQGAATVPMEISIPRRTSSGSARTTQFLSSNTSSLAFYDGPTLIYVANLSLDSSTQFTTVYAKSGTTSVAPGSCTFTSTRATCTLTVTSTVGAHKFDLIAYDQNQGQQQQAQARQRTVSDVGTPPTFVGVISSEGELAVTLNLGTNPAATLTMLGVASRVIIAGPANGPYNAATLFGYRIRESGNAQIVTPGDYDNGPITITAAPAGVVTITPNSFATPPSSAGDQNFNVTCVNPAGGTVTISFNAKTKPNTAYASALTYTTSNYSAAVIATTSFTCDPATATIPITVQ